MCVCVKTHRPRNPTPKITAPQITALKSTMSNCEIIGYSTFHNPILGFGVVVFGAVIVGAVILGAMILGEWVGGVEAYEFHMVRISASGRSRVALGPRHRLRRTSTC